MPLALTEAVELFTLRATARHRGEAVDAVHDLCRSLDGLPLAIELAAARTKTLSIAEIGRRLDDRFSVLSDPTSRRPERRRALKATIQWSYELLFPDDQRGLWALAAFAGGAPLPAVESVLEALDVPPSAAIDVVGRLANRSLVIVDDDNRYRLLDSIRAFALEAMAQSGLTERAQAAHAGWYADAAGASTAGVRSRRQADHLAFARAERANLDAALAWSETHDPLLAIRIVNGFGWAWIVLGDSRGAQRLLRALDAAGEAAPLRDRAGALLLAAWIEASTGRLELAREHIAAATELAEAIDDVDLQARCCYYLAYVVSHDGEFGQALELTDRSRALYQGLDRPWDQAANWALRRPSRDLRRRPRARRRGPRSGRALAANRRRPVAARPPRRDARRTGADRASVRRRRPAHRPSRGDVGTARLPADGGVPALQPRAGTVPGRRLRVRRGHAGARDREGRSHRRRAPGGARPRPSRARPAGDRADRDRHARRSRRRRPGIAPPAAESRPRSAIACWRRSTPATRSPGQSSGSSRSSPQARREGDAPVEVLALDALARIAADARRHRHRARPVRGSRSADGSRVALHHRPRPQRRPRGQADRLSITPPRRSPGSRSPSPAPRPRGACDRRAD